MNAKVPVSTVLLITISGLLALVAPTDPDLWWHLRNGQRTLAEGLAMADPYSFTALGRPWIAHEWGFEISAFILKNILGYRALILMAGLIQAGTVWLLFQLLRSMGVGSRLANLLLGCFVILAVPTWGVRAQILMAPFLAVFYLVLVQYQLRPERKRLLAVLPVVMLLWTNTHASFVLGIGLLGIFYLGNLLNRLYGPDKTAVRSVPLFWTLCACGLATLVNPYFFRLWTYPVPFIFSSDPVVRYIEEWQPLNLGHTEDLLLLALTGVLFALAFTKFEKKRWRLSLPGRINPTNAMLIGSFTAMALRYPRLESAFGIIVLPIIGKNIVKKVRSLSAAATDTAHSRKIALPMLVVVTAVFFCLPQSQFGNEPRTDTKVPYPAAAASFVEGLGGLSEVRMYNEYVWGGYLLYRLYPRSLVFIDGRADLYREHVMDDYFMVQNLDPTWRQILARYGVNLALIKKGTPVAKALALESEWRLTYEDEVSVIYQRLKGK